MRTFVYSIARGTSSTPYQTAEKRASLAVRTDESLRAIRRRAWYSLLSGGSAITGRPRGYG